ncbi:MAG: aryl-sulfate sulfotransferase [Chitinophagales bacterium]
MRGIKVVSLLLCFLFSIGSIAQPIPPYKVNVLTPASTGYYFLTPAKFNGTPGAYPPTHLILDAQGNMVYYKKFSGNAPATDFKIQPNGLMSYLGSGKFMLMDSTFTVTDSVSCADTFTVDAHDMKILPNGHYLLLGSANVQMDLSGYHYFSHNGSPGSATANVRCGIIQELDVNKNPVFFWNSKDHYLFSDVDSSFLNTPNSVDWTHFNAVDKDADGNILVSSRHFNEITKIDSASGNIIWRLGGKQNQFTFINDAAKFHGQHDIRRLNNGNYSLFDDGNAKPPVHAARGKEYQLNTATMQANLVWSFMESATLASQATGSVQRLPNGNTLIDWGVLNNYNLTLNVIDNGGNKVFELAFDDTLYSYRAYNYASLPWALHRPQLVCGHDSSGYYLEPAQNYSSYLWNTGETTKRVYVTAADTLTIFVPYGQAGFIASEPFAVTNIAEPCGPTALAPLAEATFTVMPNPTEGEITLSFNALPQQSLLEVFDLQGKLMLATQVEAGATTAKLSLAPLANGIYLLRCKGSVSKLVKR